MKNKMKQHILTSICILILLSACTKPKKDNVVEEPPITVLNEKIIIANEGGFGKANAEISYINPNTNEITNDLFSKANNNGVLGDVLQSISFKNNTMYCVLNNSGTIKVLNNDNYQLSTSISNLNSPRYLSFINANAALVTSLAFTAASNPLQVINTNTNTKANTLKMSGWSEGIYTFGNSTYICNYTQSKLYKLNTTTLQFTDSLVIGIGAKEIILYKNNHLLLLTDGDFNNPSSVSSLYEIDTASLTAIDSIQFNASGYSNINYSNAENVISLLGDNKLQQVNLSTKTYSVLTSAAVGESFYGFGFDEKYKKYYVCDAKDYQQKGKIIVLDKNGNRLTAYDAGYVPSKIYFNYK
jgi:hypothetical protein